MGPEKICVPGSVIQRPLDRKETMDSSGMTNPALHCEQLDDVMVRLVVMVLDELLMTFKISPAAAADNNRAVTLVE